MFNVNQCTVYEILIYHASRVIFPIPDRAMFAHVHDLTAKTTRKSTG